MEKGKLIWRLTLVIFAGMAVLGTFLLFFFSYESITAWMFNAYAQPEKLQKFRNELLTESRFGLLKTCCVLLTGLVLVLLLLAWNRYYLVKAALTKLYSYLTKQARKFICFWQAMPLTERYVTIGLFVLLFILRLYFLFRVPFHIDERFTYLYFVSKGLGVSMAYYPNPNNHLFFTLLCNITAFFTANPWLVMKVTAFICGMLLIVVYWLVIRLFFNFPVTLLATILFSCSAPVWYYGLQGRGYSLLMVLLLIAINSLLSISRSPKPAFAHFFWLWLSCTLGLYTILVFIYPFVGLMAFAVIVLLAERKIVYLKKLFITCIFIAVSTLALYIPVFIFNGWQAVTANGWVAPQPWPIFSGELPAYLLSLAENMWGYLPAGQWILCLVLLYSLFMLLQKKYATATKQWIALFCCCVVSAVNLSILQRVFLFQRLVIYLSVLQYLILAILTADLLGLVMHKPLYRLYAIGSICLLYISFNFASFYSDTSPEKFDLYDSFDATADLLYRNNAGDIFVNMYEYGLCIRFQYETNNKPVQITSQQLDSKTDFQYLVIHKNYPVPARIQLSSYQRIYADAEAMVYKRIVP